MPPSSLVPAAREPAPRGGWSLIFPTATTDGVLSPTGSRTARAEGGLGADRERLMRGIADLLAAAPASSSSAARAALRDELSSAEERVLRYLPTNLTASEIAAELYVSVNTVKTHMRHIYAKLNGHRRREVVERARSLGLLRSASLARARCAAAA